VGNCGNHYTKKWVKGLSPPPDIMTFPNFLTILTHKFIHWHSVRPIFIHKVMNNYLSNIPTTIQDINDIYIVNYIIDQYSGTCIYNKYKPISRFQYGDILQLTECNMVDIVKYINEKSPLNEGDLINLQREIREHSLSTLKHYLSSGSLSHI
jgi:hypothetical protein